MNISTYPYQPYAGDGGSPSLQVTLLGTNGREHSTLALVDTGAEWSMLPTALGVELGAEPGGEFCPPIQTQHAGGLSDAFWWNGTSQENAAGDELRVRFGAFEVPLAPTLKPHIDVVVLGRIDFLSSFRFSVDQRSETFTLEPYEEPLSAWLARTSGSAPTVEGA
jgi:hypothetical protein